MKVGTLCQVCEGEKGEHTCQKCGRLVGRKCWKGFLCKDCATGVVSA